MNKYDYFLLTKLIEKRQSNVSNDNSVIVSFKVSNKVYVKNECLNLSKTSDKRTLENRLSRLLNLTKIERFEKQGDGKTYKVFLPVKRKIGHTSNQIPLF